MAESFFSSGVPYFPCECGRISREKLNNRRIHVVVLSFGEGNSCFVHIYFVLFYIMHLLFLTFIYLFSYRYISISHFKLTFNSEISSLYLYEVKSYHSYFASLFQWIWYAVLTRKNTLFEKREQISISLRCSSKTYGSTSTNASALPGPVPKCISINST